MSFDNVCKLLAEKYPADFVRWLIAEESANIKVLKKTLIRQLLSEDIMQESVIYQDILQKGQEQGKQQEAFSLCMSLVEERFGEIDESIYQKVQNLKIEQLEALCRSLLRMSEMDDLVTWLEQQQSR